MMEQCQQRWRGYGKRERALLILCGGLLALLLAQQLLLAPLTSYQQRAEKRQLQAQRDLLWMQAQRPRLNSLLAQRPQPSDIPLPELLQNSAQPLGVKFTTQGELPPQTFPPVLAWLTQLEFKYGIQVEKLQLNHQADGLLNGKVRFKDDE